MVATVSPRMHPSYIAFGRNLSSETIEEDGTASFSITWKRLHWLMICIQAIANTVSFYIQSLHLATRLIVSTNFVHWYCHCGTLVNAGLRKKSLSFIRFIYTVPVLALCWDTNCQNNNIPESAVSQLCTHTEKQHSLTNAHGAKRSVVIIIRSIVKNGVLNNHANYTCSRVLWFLHLCAYSLEICTFAVEYLN